MKKLTNRINRLESKIMSPDLPGFSKKEVALLQAFAAGKIDSRLSENLIDKSCALLAEKVYEAAADPNFDETPLLLEIAQWPDVAAYIREHHPEFEPYTRIY